MHYLRIDKEKIVYENINHYNYHIDKLDNNGTEL